MRQSGQEVFPSKETLEGIEELVKESMRDYYNDPPEEHLPPECCGDYMDINEDTGVAKCPKCGKLIEPQRDIEPVDEQFIWEDVAKCHGKDFGENPQ
jgi:hypothetical protein